MQEQKLQSVIEYFYEWEENDPDRIFLRQPSGDQWTELSFGQAGEQARRMVSALYAKGLQPGDQVGIYSKNCSHWFLADLAIMIG